MIQFPEKTALSAGQRKIADFVEHHADEVLFMTEQEIARRLRVSIATVSRFWRAVGYDNAKDFKMRMREAAEATPALKLNKTISRLDPGSLPVKLFEEAVSHLQETVSELAPGALEQAASLLISARTLYIYAPGPSRALAELLSFRLARFGFNLVVTAGSGHELLESLMHVGQEDVLLLFAFTRMLPEAEVILDCAKEAGARTVLVTDREDLRYGLPVTLSLYVSRGEIGEFHSMVTPLLLVEQIVLSVGLLRKDSALAKLDRLARLREQYGDRLPRS